MTRPLTGVEQKQIIRVVGDVDFIAPPPGVPASRMRGDERVATNRLAGKLREAYGRK